MNIETLQVSSGNISDTKPVKPPQPCISHNWDKANRKCYNCGVLEKDIYINRRESPGC